MELVINTYGVSISRDNEGFVISNADGRQRVPVVGIDSIQIGKGAQITSDAVMLAVEHEIEVIFADKSGQPLARIWSPKYGSISTIRKGQLTFSFSSDAVTWIKDIILHKIENQQALLLMLAADDTKPELRQSTDKAIRRLEDYRAKIRTIEGDIVSDIAPTLRGWEGIASKIYFEALAGFIPEQYHFEKRTRQPATDITNAMLNYGYGLLYGRIEGALIKAGIDPYIGIMHRDDYNRPVLVYDVIEIYRVWVDYVVVRLLSQQAITEDHYSIHDDGSYWMEALGRRILIQSLNDYLDEVVSDSTMPRSRMTQINLYAQSLAQRFKRYNQAP